MRRRGGFSLLEVLLSLALLASMSVAFLSLVRSLTRSAAFAQQHEQVRLEAETALLQVALDCLQAETSQAQSNRRRKPRITITLDTISIDGVRALTNAGEGGSIVVGRSTFRWDAVSGTLKRRDPTGSDAILLDGAKAMSWAWRDESGTLDIELIDAGGEIHARTLHLGDELLR
ncbi:MAG: prepilin-type N-terminal cleavage/methylation domain-containing protein [Planctomycetota bacterium]